MTIVSWHRFLARLLACLLGGLFALNTHAAEKPDEIKAAPITTKTKSVDAAPIPADREELKLDLPKPMFIGTPTNIKSPNLEKITGKKRPPFLVPRGTVLLSAHKPVSASDAEPIVGEMAMLTDGDKDGGEGSYVEFGPGTQWVQIDLGKACELSAILLWHYHSEARVYRDVVVKVGDDPDFINDVKVLFNNDHDNSSGLGIGQDKEYIEVNEGRLIDARGVKGRYVRLYSNGNTSNDQNHYVEVEIFGKPL